MSIMLKKTKLNNLYSICVLAFITLYVQSVSAQERLILDVIERETDSGDVELKLLFAEPLQYINHAPTSSAKDLQIQMRPLRNLTSDQYERESLVPGSSDIGQVEYELDSTSGLVAIRVRFNKKMKYTVESGRDYREIRLIIKSSATVSEQKPNEIMRPEIVPAGSLKIKPEKSKSTSLKNKKPAVDTNKSLSDVGNYVVNLQSTTKRPNISDFDMPAPYKSQHLYITKINIDGKNWYRLRLGFFKTYNNAQGTQSDLKSLFSGAWVSKVPSSEIVAALGIRPVLDRSTEISSITERDRQIQPVDLKPLPSIPDNKIADIMEQARQAMATKAYDRAVQLYTKVLRYPSHIYSQAAQEFLGLARERKKQFAHARREYDKYLARYPEGEGADRVRQRLAALLTARKSPKKALSKGSRIAQDEEGTQWRTYGSFSQFYRRDILDTEPDGSRVTQNNLSTDLDFSARGRGKDLDTNIRFTGGYLQDFLDGSSENSSRVSSMYIDLNHKATGLSTRLGRQTRSTGGVSGRFDGGLLGYRFSEQLKLNLVAGYPVNTSSDGLNTDRSFFGASVDLGTYANAWDFVLFYIDQSNEGIVDRQAVGGEFRYFTPEKSLFGLVDYDIHFKSLNTFLLIGNLNLPGRLSLNAQFDYRASPFLTSQNALQGQSVSTIGELLGSFTEDQIYQLAKDRTTESKSLTIGLSRPLNEKLQLSGDITLTELGSTIASGGVDAVPGTGVDKFYNLQLIGSDLFKPGDITVGGLRYSDTSTTSTTSISLNTRYPVNKQWRLNPRLRLDYKERVADNSTEWIFIPTFRMDYRLKRRYYFEFEFGGEVSKLSSPTTSDTTITYYLNAGYRIDF